MGAKPWSVRARLVLDLVLARVVLSVCLCARVFYTTVAGSHYRFIGCHIGGVFRRVI